MLLAGIAAVWVLFDGNAKLLLGFTIRKGEAIFFVGCIAFALYAPSVRRLPSGQGLVEQTFWSLVAGTVLINGLRVASDRGDGLARNSNNRLSLGGSPDDLFDGDFVLSSAVWQYPATRRQSHGLHFPNSSLRTAAGNRSWRAVAVLVNFRWRSCDRFSDGSIAAWGRFWLSRAEVIALTRPA